MKNMAIGIGEYKKYIIELKNKGMQDGKKEIIVIAKQLQQEIDPEGKVTMYTCCKAIKDLLLEGDKILCDPPTPSGYSSMLKVRYNLEGMTERSSYYIQPKKGRPIECFHLEQLEEELYKQFNEQRFQFLKKEKMFKSIDGKWCIYFIETKANNVYKARVFDILCQLKREDIYKISFVFKYPSKTKKFWNILGDLKDDYPLTYLQYENGILKEYE